MVHSKFKRYTDEEFLFESNGDIYYYKYVGNKYNTLKPPRILFYKQTGDTKRKTIKKVLISEFIMELKHYLNRK